MSTNKQSNKLHIAVSVAFSYLLQCRVKTGGKLLLFIVFQRIQQKGGRFLSTDKTINNSIFSTSFHSALMKVAECYWNCNMQFVWLFMGVQNVVFSLIVICAKLRLTIKGICIVKGNEIILSLLLSASFCNFILQ